MLSDASTPEDPHGPDAGSSGKPAPSVHVAAAALLDAVTSGSRSAFEELYELVMPRVYGLCVRLIRDRAIAEEVAQEVMLTVWQRSAQFDVQRGTALGWILTLTHRKAVDRIRHVEATRNRDRRYLESVHDIATDSTADAALDSLDAARVRQILTEMSDNHRRALTLTYFDGLTHSQVARHLGIPLGTAKSRIRDALISLRTRTAGQLDATGAAS